MAGWKVGDRRRRVQACHVETVPAQRFRIPMPDDIVEIPADPRPLPVDSPAIDSQLHRRWLRLCSSAFLPDHRERSVVMQHIRVAQGAAFIRSTSADSNWRRHPQPAARYFCSCQPLRDAPAARARSNRKLTSESATGKHLVTIVRERSRLPVARGPCRPRWGRGRRQSLKAATSAIGIHDRRAKDRRNHWRWSGRTDRSAGADPLQRCSAHPARSLRHRRGHLPHGEFQRLPNGHRRPPILLQVGLGHGVVATDSSARTLDCGARRRNQHRLPEPAKARHA